MGKDKRFLFVGEHTLLERSLAVLQGVFQSVSIVIGDDSTVIEARVPVWRDIIPNCGSLGGIYTGLKLSKTPYIFAVACDMPFISPIVIQYLVSLKNHVDVVMPRSEFGPQPTHALYSGRCLPVIETMVRSGRLSIKDVVNEASLRVRWVQQAEISGLDPGGRSFFNVNTPEELETARKMAGPSPVGS
ncbi:MAG: molybdenum cofactor guanylyltransferase [Nitrospira sp.]|nr:molybdenum cofactor guanylyltransferase [Nitrospira sp.]